MTTVHDCTLIDLPRITQTRGSITPVEGNRTIPFDIARVFYLYDISGGANRGGHAHRELQQVIVCVMGAFDFIVDDGIERRRIYLHREHQGLYVPTMVWGELTNFSSGAICLVLASLPYNEEEYIRDYPTFLREKTGHTP